MTDPKELISRLKTIKIYAMLSPNDCKIVDDAIEYINNNEERMKINRPDPLFPKNLFGNGKDNHRG